MQGPPFLFRVHRHAGAGARPLHVCFFEKPILPAAKHVPVRKHLQNFRLEPLGLEGIRPTELPLSPNGQRLDVEETKLRVATELSKSLSDGKLFVEEEPLAFGRGDRDYGRRDADDAVGAQEVHLTRLRDGVFGRGGADTGGRVCVDAFHVNRACKERAVEASIA
jgi:hypothetical protein